MCIRDSHFAPVAPLDVGMHHLPHDRPGTDQRDLDDDVVEAVSYTHLRAHETVLDLVCRLLLEKKKNLTYHIYSLCLGYMLIIQTPDKP